jgi:hypothetical protein
MKKIASLSFGEEWGQPDLRDLLALRVEENRADQGIESE